MGEVSTLELVQEELSLADRKHRFANPGYVLVNRTQRTGGPAYLIGIEAETTVWLPLMELWY